MTYWFSILTLSDCLRDVISKNYHDCKVVFCQWETELSQIWQKLGKSYWIWTNKNRKKITANLDTFINDVNHLSNFLNSWKTWINIKDMYILTYIPQCWSVLYWHSDEMVFLFSKFRTNYSRHKIFLTFAQNVNKLLE